jgi:starch synthase (maltosyl-transferring)
MTIAQGIRAPVDDLKAIAGRGRAAIEGVQPELDCGRFPIKRVVGETVVVQADIFADGHDHIDARLLYRWERESEWTRVPMRPTENDRWSGKFACCSLGRYVYTIEAWTDALETWRSDLVKRIAAGQDISVDLLIGAALIEEAAGRARGQDADRLWAWARLLRDDPDEDRKKAAALHEDLLEIARAYPDPKTITRYAKELDVEVDREKARFSAWYEMFPRSCSHVANRHGTFRDMETWLPYVASMGFDVLYLPPIHPIGRSFRKGRNNATAAADDDVGSPWAIGAREGGHTAIHPELGGIEDFRRLIGKAREYNLEIALDLAFQVAPDHPYVRDHPEWFRARPDGTIQYAENPPKKYQDIYPFDFSSDEWPELWRELEAVVEFWINLGVRIFRVDNPHTKPFAFWEWLIRRSKARDARVIFLAEAFTRPKVMYQLAKAGFSQSYTYFAWRNSKQEIQDYFTELTGVADYFRPNLWPNTPDILTAFLQTGGPAAFQIRVILAATLGASYGIYGPAFELCENHPREPGSEEYLHSEKYELKHWDVANSASLKDLIARINGIRRENAAFHSDRSLRFHQTDNPNLICYSKTTDDLSNVIVVVVNLDPAHRQWGFVELELPVLGINSNALYQATDLLYGGNYTWQGSRNYVELTPGTMPAHVLRLRNGS